MQKKGQSRGLVSGLIFGIAGLIVAVIIAFVIVGTLVRSDLIEDDATGTYSYANDSITFDDQDTPQTLTATSYANANRKITCGTPTFVHNVTKLGASLGVGNVTISSDCTIINATAIADDEWLWNGTVYVTYPYTSTEQYTKNAVGNMSGNFSEGINNISSKVPTVLLVATIILILGVLAVLVGVWQKMRMGGSSI